MNIMPKNDKLEFQIYDWLEDHEEEEDEDTINPGKYIIHIFGRCLDGKSVYGKIKNFTPYFYILLPNKFQTKTKLYNETLLMDLEAFLKSKENKKIFYKYKNSLIRLELHKFKKAEGFTNDKEYYFARLVFNNVDGLQKYKYFFDNNEVTIENNKYKFKLYEANLLSMLRCFHIKNINGCGWVEVLNYNLIHEDDKISRCNIEISIDWTNLIPQKKDYNAPLRICAFDIECNSIDGEFPQAKRSGDAIIQIGATYTYLGESTPYRQYIACLKNTSPLDNIIVESYETETELIYGFITELINSDCDIITGYNIFFFDEKYIFDRCKDILKIDISFMSKLKYFKCNFTEIKLSSSALGDNLLKFWQTPGRIHIDLMKDIQKTFSLPSYKLDFVSSKFIRGDILSIQIIPQSSIDNYYLELTCDNIQDICIGDFIHIEVVKGFISDEIGNKYLIVNIDSYNKKIIIKNNKKNNLISEILNKVSLKNDVKQILLENKSYLDIKSLKIKLNWSQAKDDIGPKDIFRLYKGSPEDRSIIAKYCIKDCKLVNLLINKLEIITKNIEMANVCYVPLSFLFTRGQGIKLFSLCLREYRKQKYIFPVIKLKKSYRCLTCENEYDNSWTCPKCQSKKREEIEMDSSSFVGALVFDPIPRVEYEALATKDYMSLYPSSIMHKNMSHETIVEDPMYDNLPNVKYYQANFKDSDGSVQYRKFAQINNKLGVIPTILNNLLKERKIIKQIMKTEKDPFKYKILDAKQNAIKITANSLYGQLGAATSPIQKRDIAACTTSTGREMLILAKKYDEEILPCIINTLKYYYEHNDKENINKLYDLEIKDRQNEKIISSLEKFILTIKNITCQPIVRYGDSIIGEMPLLLRNSISKKIFIKTIGDLVPGNQYKILSFSDKETAYLNNVEIWTEKGWTTIKCIIRHKLAPYKKLFRVNTYSGSVVVTDDHSLLITKNFQITEIKPQEIKFDDILLHSFPILHPKTRLEDLDGYNEINNPIPYKTKCAVDALTYYYNIKKLGKHVEVNFNENYYILCITKETKFDLRKIELYNEPEEYVYDLTTENHHFHAGVGSLIVHNTDSIFSCYRFRDNTKIINFDDALILWKKIIKFGHTLLAPFIPYHERCLFTKIFNEYYNTDNLDSLKLPQKPEIEYHSLNSTRQHKSDFMSTEYLYLNELPLEQKLKIFIKEYMEESYLPWLWLLCELVEKDNTSAFDIKVIQWANHLLEKINLTCENLYENRKKKICQPILNALIDIFKNNSYFVPSDKIIHSFTQKLKNDFSFKDEIKLDYDKLFLINKTLLQKTLKDKWIYSEDNKEIQKNINNYLKNIIQDYDKKNITKEIKNSSEFRESFENIIFFIKKYIKDNNNLDIYTLSELLYKNLLKYKNINFHLKIFKSKVILSIKIAPWAIDQRDLNGKF